MTPGRILLVTGSLECGGAERVLADMANYWAEKRVDVTFATWSGPEVHDFFPLDRAVRRAWLDVPLVRNTVLRQLHASFRRVRKLRRLIRNSRPDAVLSFIHTSNVLSILASIGLRTRIVVSERMQPAVDPSLSVPWKLMRRLVYRLSDAAVAQSREAACWIGEYCGKHAIVIPNHLRSLPLPGTTRRALVLAVGRLEYQKGFDLLLRAFAAIAAEFPEWQVAIAGEGRQRDSLVRLRDELGLGRRVEFAGQLADIENWMSTAGLIVQPSRFEGFPNVILEAMGMGAPVIAADCRSGPAEMIEDGINGRLVAVDDVAALSGAMAELMSQPAIREKLGREAAKVRERFSQAAIMAKWESCLASGTKVARA